MQFIKNCTELIRNYRNEVNLKTSSSKSSQVKDHFTLVLNLIEVYLKTVCNLYTQQKAIRVKRACEKQRLARLASSFSSGRPVFPVASTAGSSRDMTTSTSRNIDNNTRRNREQAADHMSQITEERPPSRHEETLELTPQEIQLFDQENSQLYDKLNS